MEHTFYEFPIYIISKEGNDILNWEVDGGQYLAVQSASMMVVGDIVSYKNHPAADELFSAFGTLNFIVIRREVRWTKDISDCFPYTPTLYLKPYDIESSLEEKKNEPNSFKLTIDKLPLSKAIITLLQNQEILTVRDLVAYTENGIENIKFMKWIGVEDIKKALANMGLSLGMKVYN